MDRIELVMPYSKGHTNLDLSAVNTFNFPPLNLASLASYVPDGIDVEIVDERYRDPSFDPGVDAVCITCLTPQAPRAYEIAEKYRDIGTKVVMGGIHPTVRPEEASNYSDAVVVGEAEDVWPGVVRDLTASNRELQDVYTSDKVPSLENLPRPERDLYSGKYGTEATIRTTRGCPYNCDFCSVATFHGDSYRHRPVEDVVEEVKEMDDDIVFFLDDNIIGDPKYSKKLFQAMTDEELGIKWLSQASINVGKDEELLQLARDSGCMGLFLGFESISEQSLDECSKSQNHIEEYERIIDRVHSHGIGIEGAFIFGFDHDTPRIFKKTVDFAKRNELELAQFAILTPFPGTTLFEEMERQDRIITKNWSLYDCTNVVYEPKNMDRNELQQGFNWAWKEFYGGKSILSRMLRGRRHPLFYSLFNLGFRKAVKRSIGTEPPVPLRETGRPEPSPVSTK